MSVPPPRITGMEVAARNDLTQALDDAVFLMAAASAEALEFVASCDDKNLWSRDGATSMTSWLAGRYGLAWGTAREWVRVAHALRKLPGIAQAYASGRLSWDQLRPLTRFATPETDQFWARKATSLRPSSLHREARRHERIPTEEEAELHSQRFLSLLWDHEHPVLHLEGMLASRGRPSRRPWSAGPRRWSWPTAPWIPGRPAWPTPWWSW
jgi:Domain of unknown function (DUF222)